MPLTSETDHRKREKNRQQDGETNGSEMQFEEPDSGKVRPEERVPGISDENDSRFILDVPTVEHDELGDETHYRETNEKETHFLYGRFSPI
ncbi:hypothetical protein GCM10009000_043310 [Halobacterium noricense]|uniref:Uncharacterized protein n=1 Tax=Haladaptatus pallidirubidus TaxID=1008152 RepID=A0AAV3UFD4_9EURY